MQFDLTDRDTLFASLPRHTVGAEVGVSGGGFSPYILQTVGPRLLFLIDCWEHQSLEVYGHDPSNADQNWQDNTYQRILQQYLLNDHVRVVKAYSQKAVLLFPNGFFDWVFLDANHLECYADATAWFSKVKNGGWLIGHDYVIGGVDDWDTVQVDMDRFSAERGLPLLLTDDEIWKCWILQKPEVS